MFHLLQSTSNFAKLYRKAQQNPQTESFFRVKKITLLLEPIKDTSLVEQQKLQDSKFQNLLQHKKLLLTHPRNYRERENRKTKAQ